ncbi:MAG TPA: ABC transporter ATP-binding protein [Alphaproteobacteria bacterium]|nr:ABC transporter ATP-binding protein [Alphaproteobacteria bacterium]HAJ47720.1 ABC transporter ATP-binding protein [Alphaproteobacteria bacterium]
MIKSGAAVLHLEQVSKSYGKFAAVKDLGFRVAPGEIFGFLGPNGAGKTSTIRMMLGILEPDHGKILLFGKPWSREALSKVGYLPEERGLYKDMKAAAVVAYFATLKGLSYFEARRRARAILDRFELSAFANKKVSSLSKGMAQKVQLAAAIAHDPEFLILDEPFSGLDPLNQQVLEQVILEQAKRGCAVLFSTHTMQHAERLCDRLLIMTKGQKAFDGTLADARASQPRRIRIEADRELTFLAQSAAVLSVTPPHPPSTFWEVLLKPGAEPHQVLEACFKAGVRINKFDASEMSLHEIFVAIAGVDPEADAQGSVQP